MKGRFNTRWAHIVSGMLLLIGAAVAEIALAASPWQEEWERVIKAAKSEGKLALIGPLGADRRDALSQGFQSKYGITVESHADATWAIRANIPVHRTRSFDIRSRSRHLNYDAHASRNALRQFWSG